MPLRAHQALGKDGRSEDQRKDLISHFILRIAYCRTEDLRRWFLEKECQLIRFRLEKLTDLERSQVMAANGLEYEMVSEEAKMARKDKLVGVSGVTEATFYGSASTFYKVPYTQALSLVATRGVYIEAGFAYVPMAKLMAIIISKFRLNLSKALVDASSMFDHVSSDPRIGPLLKNVHKQYVGKDYSKAQALDKLTPDKVDQAADVNMPLCMKNLHNALKKDHKLKHWGRLQYGLFLKGAGLELEDAQTFWEMHFTKIMSHDDFVKKYSYSFRHMYGKEGARKSYTPYSCMKIIMGTPPEPGAFHGCPYRHMDNVPLSALLSSLSIGGNDVKEIVTLAKTSNYQVACQKHFDITHPGHAAMGLNNDVVANHPNQWFQASVLYHKTKAGGGVVSTESSSMSLPSSEKNEVSSSSLESSSDSIEMTS